MWIALGAAGCGGDPRETAPCSVALEATGAVDLSWGPTTPVLCDGYGPWIDDSIDLYFEDGFEVLRIRVDFVRAGETGAFTDTFVSLESRDQEWGSFGDVQCDVTLDRNEDVGKSELGFRAFEVAGAVACDAPLEAFGGEESEVTVGPIEFEGWYEEALDD